MPIFIVETAATSPIREYWKVEADTPEEAAETYGDKGQCLYDEVLGEEEGRQVSEVHTEAALASFFAAEAAQQEAPAMLEALRNLLPLWSSGIDEPWVLDARAILARIDAPTAQPAGDDPAITAAANLSRAALVEAAGEALALQAPISEAEPVQTFTAFCQEADGTGTIWIQQVKAETIADATAAARRDCAEDWGFDVEQVHCLGLARGDCQIVHWEDAAP